MAKGNRFQKGSGCFTCVSCGKRTRATGTRDHEFCKLCLVCFENAGIENSHSDEGHEGDVSSCPTCLAMGYRPRTK